MKKSIKLTFLLVTFMCISAISAFAQNDSFIVKKIEFDPDKTKTIDVFWKQGIGLRDSNCKTDFGLRLVKAAPEFAAAAAELKGLEGVVVQPGETLGYDIRNDSTCTGSSPRFNVSWTLNGMSGFSFVGSCLGDPESMPSAQNPNWTRLIFELQDPTEATPIVPIGATLKSVVLVADDVGQYTVDNIQFRQHYADKPGKAGLVPFCP